MFQYVPCNISHLLTCETFVIVTFHIFKHFLSPDRSQDKGNGTYFDFKSLI